MRSYNKPMKTCMLNETGRQTLLTKISKELSERSDIEFAYVFGSFNTGVFRDVDVAVFLSHGMSGADALKLELELERRLGFIAKLDVDVRILNRSPLSFRYNVIRTGKPFLSKNESARSDFESLTLVEHHDFEFYRRSYRKEVLAIGV
ncbi:MAG: nucleotidyltransferase domain-containing protein [Thermoplasmata archaeon HGW-Thermoplasmata-1]|nr:MAG: nucleotidyltransferase domain-containing protein [Thermoplasmata archaeon HGW-Thermoplasmata-1]